MPKMLSLVLRDKEDRALCRQAAKANGFPNISDWFRAIINGHLHMMGWRNLKYVSRRRVVCKNGHEYTPENTYQRTKGKYKFKVCKECNRQAQKRNAEMLKMRRKRMEATKRIAS